MGGESMQAVFALALGGLAVLTAVARAERPAPRLDLTGGAAAIGLLAAVALVSLLRQPPFSSGQALAPAVLIGGLGVLLAYFAALRIGDGDRLLTGAAALGAAAAAAGVLLLIHPRGNVDACAGLALGALLAGMAVTALGRTGSAGSMEFTIPAFVAVASATLLATYHLAPQGGSPAARDWMAHPSMMAGAGAAVIAALTLARRRATGTYVATAAVLLGFAALVGQYLNGGTAFAPILLLGFAAAPAVAHLLADPDQPESGREATSGYVAVLLGLGAVVLAFRGLHGYGLTLAAVGGGIGLACLPGLGRRREHAWWLLLLPGLHRIFYEGVQYDFDPDAFYLLVSLAVGLLTPYLLSGLRATPAGVVIGGGAALGLPLAARLLVGDEGQAAVVAGLVLAAVAAPAAPVARRGGLAPGLYSALGVLSAVQFTRLLTPLEMVTRSERVGLLAGIIVLAALSHLLLRRSAAPAEAEGATL